MLGMLREHRSGTKADAASASKTRNKPLPERRPISRTISRRRASSALAVPIVTLLSAGAFADDNSAGPNGINSRNLGLSGAGQSIGQVELGRPGEKFSAVPDADGEWYWDYGADGMPGTGDAGEGNGVYTAGETYVNLDGNGIYTPGWVNAHLDVEPWLTRVNGGAPASRSPILPNGNASAFLFINENTYLNMFYNNSHHSIDGHALQVAGVMIATGAADRGVATGAKLYSGAFGRSGATHNDVIVTTQDIVRQAFDPVEPALSNIRSVNHSWGAGPSSNDGSSQLTLAMDYFAKQYDTLQVIAGDELQAPPSHPGNRSDLYNGINVSMLRIDPGTQIFDRYDAGNRYVPPANGRINVQLAAPGVDINMPQLGGNGYGLSTGTSFAAPHVTATAALLHEYGDAQRVANPAKWDASARRHQVMKAVILNSADKIKDDGLYVPVGNALGMEKTIYKNPTGTQTFLDSPAYANTSIPLDDHIGAGALNANRALKQFKPGEWDEGGQIPLIGWDHGFTYAGSAHNYDYFFNVALASDSFISATLAWDRDVTLMGGDAIFTPGETFADGGLVDLDLQLLKRNDFGIYELLTQSNSTVDNLEHMFYNLTLTGSYALRLREFGSDASIEYGLAWWAVPVPEPATTLLLAAAALVLRRRRRT